MHKRQRERTETGHPHKKGYKLKNLTKLEAIDRAKEAWQTKHERYQYLTRLHGGLLHKQEDDVPYFRRSSRESRKAAREDAAQHLGVAGRIVHEDEAFDAPVHEQGKVDDRVYQAADRLAKDRYILGKTKKLSDKEKQRIVASIPEDKQDDLIALYIARAEAYQSQRKGYKTKDLYGDPVYAGVRMRGYSRINPEPEVGRGSDRISAAPPMRVPGGIQEPLPFRDKKLEKQRRKAIVEAYHSIADLPEVQKAIGEKITNKEGKVVGYRSEHPELDQLIREYAHSAAASNFADTPEVRTVARREAQRKATRIAQITQEHLVGRRDRRQAVEAHSYLFKQPEFVEGWEKISDNAEHGAPISQFEGERPHGIHPGWVRVVRHVDDPRGIKKGKDFVPIKHILDPTEALQEGLGGVKDPREKDIDFTAEDLHKAYNLDETGFEGIKNQAKFLRDQTKNRIKGYAEGTTPIMFDENGQRTFDKDKAKLSIRPNKQYEYKLRKRNEPGEFKFETVPYEDTSTRFRDKDTYTSKGFVREGRYDPIAGVRVKQIFDTHAKQKEVGPGGVGRREWLHPEEAPASRKASNIPTGFIKLGERTAENTGVLPRGIDREVFVAREGITQRSSRDVPSTRFKDEEGVKGKYKTRITYVPEKEFNLKRGQQDEVGIASKNRYASVKPTEGSVAHILLTGPARAKERRELDERSQERAQDLYGKVIPAHYKANDPYFERNLRHELNARYSGQPEYRTVGNAEETDNHLRDLKRAGVAAVAYGAKKKLDQEQIPRLYQKFRETKTGQYLSTHVGMPVNIRDFNEGAVKPIEQKIADKIWELRHPLSSPTGETAGIEWGRWRYRGQDTGSAFGLKPQTIEARGLELQRRQLEKTFKQKQFFDESAYSESWLRRRMAKRRDNLYRQKSYSNFDNELIDTLSKLGGLKEHSTQGKVKEEAEKSYQILDKVREQAFAEDLRAKAWTGGKALVLYGEKQPVTPTGVSAGDVAVGTGVVAATALAGHYAYHKYQEKQRKEADPNYRGTTYYNKLLPPPITVKQPVVRVVKRRKFEDNPINRELGIANKGLPIAWGARMENRTYKFRPSDRGYAPEAKLFGGVKFGGPKGEGSRVGALTQPYGSERKRSYKRGTHELLIKGKKAPVYINVGDREVPQLSSTNPHRITQGTREEIVSAFANTPEEGRVRQFYWNDPEMQRMFEESAFDVRTPQYERDWIAERGHEFRKASKRKQAQRRTDWRGKSARESIPTQWKEKAPTGSTAIMDHSDLGGIHPDFRDKTYHEYESRKKRMEYKQTLPPHHIFPNSW